MTTTVLAALGLGLAGSVHCVAMCGPLVGLVAPVVGRHVGPATWYQVGRVTAYVVIGVLAGVAGQIVSLAGLGRGLSLVAGTALVLAALGHVIGARGQLGAWWTRQLGRLMGRVGGLRTRQPRASAVGAGLVHGALPCGLVYAAALVAATAGSPGRGAVVMAAFGAGTVPVIGVLWWSVGTVLLTARQRVRWVTPVALFVVGLLLVWRGTVDPGRHGEHAAARSEVSQVAHPH